MSIQWKYLSERIPVQWTLVGTPSWLNKTAQSVPDSFKYQVVQRKHLLPILEQLAAKEYVAIDTESSGPKENDGLNAFSATSYLVTFQIGDEERVFILEPRLLPLFKPLLQSRKPLKILQNAKHDMAFLEAKYNIRLQNVYCTMLAEQVLQDPNVSLKHLAAKYPPYFLLGKDVRKEFVEWNGTFSRQQLDYAAADVYVLPFIWRGQKSRLKRFDLEQIAQLEFDNLPVAVEMHLTGVWLDPERHSDLIEFHEKRRREIEEKVVSQYMARLVESGQARMDLFGNILEDLLNLNSQKDKMKILRAFGVEVQDTEAETLLSTGHPVAALMVEYMGEVKIVETYGHGLRERVCPDTGRIHPKFDQLGSGEHIAQQANRNETIATGRWSSDFQQLPRPERVFCRVEGEELELCRRHFASLLASSEQPKEA